jgi:hypothetical protein
VIVYPDQSDSTRFYAHPLQPRLARDESGAPLIDLMIFGRKVDGRLNVSGGQCTITVALGLTPQEQAGLENQLNGSVVHPDWLDGEVVAELLPDLSVSGKPSMMGANECTLMSNLTAAQAEQLQKAWANGLREARIRYRVTMRASTTQKSVFEQKTESYGAQGATQRSTDLRLNVTSTEADALGVTLEGPITLGPDEFAGRMQSIGF